MSPAAVLPADMAMLAGTDTHVATIQSDRLKVNGVAARRSKAPPLNGGIAAATTSDMYKCAGHGKPKAKRWDHRFTEESKSRLPNSLKASAKYFSIPGMISLGGGLPTSQYFPFEYIDIKVPTVSHFTEAETKTMGVVKRIGKYDMAEGKADYDLHVGLNYGQSIGSAQMLRFVTEHTELVHNPPYMDWQCCMDVGSTAGLDVALRLFVNRGDYILTDEYVFASAAEAARPLGARWIGLPMDAEGIIPAGLDEVLGSWKPSERHNQPRPWLLYAIPSGQNPTGATQSLERRRQLYRLAQKYDLYIIEDDPYYYLQMEPYSASDEAGPAAPACQKDLIDALVPSYLSLDIDGRVIRLDSFAKVIAPGMRAGWITASTEVVEHFMRHTEVATQNPSGVSQLLLYKLLDETWGHAGYFEWLMYLRSEYTERRNNLVGACERHLPRPLATWVPPMAGMFHWIKIDWKQHPRFSGMDPAAEISAEDLLGLEEEIYQASIAQGALVCKGSWFRAEQGNAGQEIFFRTTFAAAPADSVTEAIRRFGVALQLVFGL